MSTFLNGWNETGDFKPPKIIAIIAIIIISFFLGNLPILFLINNHPELSNADMPKLLEFFGAETLLALQIIPFAFVLIGLLLGNRFILNRKWILLFTQRNRFDYSRFFWGFAVWGILIVLNVLLDFYFKPSDYTWNFSWKPFLSSFFLLLALLPIQITTEELLFRSLVLQGFFARTRSIWASILISGIMFGSIHFGNPEIMESGYALLSVYMVFGIFLSLIVAKDNGIEITMGFHLANNLISAILVTSTNSAFQTNSILKTDSLGFDFYSLLFLLMNLVVFYLLTHLKYKWKKGFASNDIPIQKK